ncbi:protein OSB2, chloroplastic-like isoform X1 [Syzygium oleosum]|uniref:protein OSB2, chloroplastic-like isoform X1 n=1 Tax=Syzygium oleosum TaxID=219896 RepID=UPI0011D277BA|nr:protein OSB2, chloroplastic-like isoform X1 [Syzygium oleosum]
MALKQTLTSAGNAKVFVFPTSNSSGSSPNSLFSFAPSAERSTRNARLRCSLQAAAYPRPQEIQWRKELTNSVQLIGVVSTPVEVRNLPSGKVVAWTRLAVRKSPTDTTWINLTFWDELALTASQHLEKGHQIFVSGRLVSDVVESDEGKQQTFYKVVVQQLNFIERNLSLALNDHATSRNFGSNPVHNNGSTVELWQAFFANPLEWWDNRKNKKNPKYPDFKHKDTGEALWVEGRYNPPWVKSQLAKLDTRMGSLQWQDARKPVSAMASDDALSF